MISFSFVATLINHLDRQVLSVVVTVPEFKAAVRFGYTPMFIGYGLMPMIALLLILFGIGPLHGDPRFGTATP